MFKKMLTFTALNLRILNKILRDLYGQFYVFHLEVLSITPGLEGSSFLPHLALEEELLVPRHPVEGLAGPHLGPVHVAPDPGGRGLDVAQRHAHAHSRHGVSSVTSHEPRHHRSQSCLYTRLVFNRSRSTEPDFVFILLLVFVNFPTETIVKKNI